MKNIKSMLGYPILGIIPEDDKVKQAQLEKETLVNFPRSNASKAYKKLAQKLTGVRLDEKNFLGRIVDGLKNIRFSVNYKR